jgi:Domain of unknown function (DUF4440)
MKRAAYTGLGVLALTIGLFAGEPGAGVKEAVMKAENEWKTAVMKEDAAALNKLMASDLSYTHSSAKTQTKEEFIHDATGGSTTYKSITFDDTKMRQYGSDVVVVTQNAVITTEQTDVNRLYLTEAGRPMADGFKAGDQAAVG